MISKRELVKIQNIIDKINPMLEKGYIIISDDEILDVKKYMILDNNVFEITNEDIYLHIFGVTNSQEFIDYFSEMGFIPPESSLISIPQFLEEKG